MEKTGSYIIKLGIIILIIISVCFFWGHRKSDLFMDEKYSFGLANSYYAPFISSITGGDLTDKEISGKEISEYLTVGNEERFAFDSV